MAEAPEERRLVTVLFSDVSGYTTMAEHTDPEMLRSLMSLVYDRAAEVVEGYGGRIDKLMGDAVLAVFGDPVAHEDDAERAIRAAMDLHAAIRELSPRFEEATGRNLEMHSGINTGEIVTSATERDRFSGPLGDMVNVAARLQSAAGADEIVVGETTVALADGVFAWRELGPLQLKGRAEAVRAATVHPLSAAPAERAPSRRQSGFVGRHEELGVLLGAVERLRDGESTVITVCADAGVGKTRLLEEVHQRLDGVTWLEGRAYAFAQGTPYAPVIDLLTRIGGIDERDDAEAVRDKLDSLAEAAAPGDREAKLVLQVLFGQAQGEIDLEAFSDVLTAAVVRMIDGTAGRAPTVLCFQDLHWTDPSSAALIRSIAAEVTSPLVLVCNYRPGFDLGLDDARHLDLGELSERQVREQLSTLLDGEPPPHDLVELVLDRADGNPFFAEEIVNSLIEQGALARGADGWAVVGQQAASSVPSTVRALLDARIDRLDPQRKRLLREASVVGREFLHRVMRTVSSEPEHLDPGLERLSEADLIRPPADDDPDLEYVFKHALTQEVAYAGLLVKDRQVIHARAAEAIEQQFAERAIEVVETLAYHHQRSGDAVRAAGYLRQAGRKALARFALTEAHEHYQAAHDLLDAAPSDTARDRVLVETLLDWAHGFYYTAEIRVLGELLDRHADAVLRVDDEALRARWIGWSAVVAWMHRGTFAEATDLAEQARDAAAACGDTVTVAYCQAWLSWLYWYRGDTSLSIEMLERNELLFDRIDDVYDRRYVTHKTLCGAGTAAAVDGRFDVARACSDRLLALGHETGNNRALASGMCVAMCIEFVHGNHDGLIEVAERALAIDTDPVYSMLVNSWYVGTNLVAGDVDLAIERHAEVGHIAEQLDHGAFRPSARVATAQIDILEGRLSSGERGLARVREERLAVGDRWHVVAIDAFLALTPARIATGEAEASFGQALRNPGFVRRHAIGAAKKARGRCAAIEDFYVRYQFRGLLPLVELELGKLAEATKDPEDARRHYGRAIELLAQAPDAQIARSAAARLAALA